jgi:hypothetical protein
MPFRGGYQQSKCHQESPGALNLLDSKGLTQTPALIPVLRVFMTSMVPLLWNVLSSWARIRGFDQGIARRRSPRLDARLYSPTSIPASFQIMHLQENLLYSRRAVRPCTISISISRMRFIPLK